ncbi:MAG TPA: PIN domain-containing protein [Candidatus Acidoferrales bacterium]|nr:PIN domain-containing protein [Candidatus Acidoferrales bacterium]
MSANRAGKPVFDASAVLALLQGETGEEKLRKLQPQAVVNAVNAAEVLAKLVNRGMPIKEAHAAFDALHLETLPFEPAMSAISANYVHKGVSLGDRCFLAAARLRGSGWTSDHGLAALTGSLVPPLNFFR